MQGRIPKEYIPVGRKGISATRSNKGPIAGYPIVGVKAMLEDGSYHEVDSSDMAFQICARNCFRETFLKTKPVLARAGHEGRNRSARRITKARWRAS